MKKRGEKSCAFERVRCMYWRKRLLKIWVGKSYSKPHSGCTAWIGGSGFWNNGWKMGGKVMCIWKGTLKIGWSGYWKYGGESHVHFKATLYELEEAPTEKKGGKVIHTWVIQRQNGGESHTYVIQRHTHVSSMRPDTFRPKASRTRIGSRSGNDHCRPPRLSRCCSGCRDNWR